MAATKFRNKRRKKPGDLSSLRRSIWAAILTAEELCDNDSPEIQLRALNSIAQLAGAYLRTLEADDLEKRIVALESRSLTAVKQNGAHHEALI
jgi:hypothetical protein